MSRTTPLREEVLHAIREERIRQDADYGAEDNRPTGFGGSVSAYPWLLPYSDADSGKVLAAFRADYAQYEASHGQPTWMHLIREEVAELFDARTPHEVAAEAIQVAALCVSLVEQVLKTQGEA